MNRRAVVGLLIAMLGTSLTAGTSAAQNVDGTIWQFAAKNNKTGVIKQFKVRVSNLKFYGHDGTQVGFSEPISVRDDNRTAKLTLQEPLPLVGEAEVTRIGPGRVGGTLKTADGETWALKIRGVDK